MRSPAAPGPPRSHRVVRGELPSRAGGRWLTFSRAQPLPRGTVLRPLETTVYRQDTYLLTTWKSLCLAVHQARSGPNSPRAGRPAPGNSSRACPLRRTNRSRSPRRDNVCPRGLSPTPSGRGPWRFMSGQSMDLTVDTEPRAGETCMPEHSWKGQPHPCDGRRGASSSRRSHLWTTDSWHGHCKIPSRLPSSLGGSAGSDDDLLPCDARLRW